MAEKSGMTPEELYRIDQYRGSDFTGPTPEELWEFSEEQFLTLDYIMGGLLTDRAAGIDPAYLNISESDPRNGKYLWVNRMHEEGDN